MESEIVLSHAASVSQLDRKSAHFNILLVEDYQPNIIAAQALLQRDGYSCLVANSGEEAIRLFQESTFDLILMDLRMPVMSGVETTKEIRAIEKNHVWNRTPVVAMTAHIANQDMLDCIDAGIDDIIPKPFHPEYFKKTLQKYSKKLNE